MFSVDAREPPVLRRLQLVERAGGDDHVIVALGKCFAQSEPDAGAAVGDEDGTPGKCHAGLLASSEVGRAVQVGDESRLMGAPSQELLRLGAGGRNVHGGKVSKPAEVGGRLVRVHADNGYLQAPPDDFGDLPEGHTFFGGPVVVGSRAPPFPPQPKHPAPLQTTTPAPPPSPLPPLRTN